MAVRFTPAAAYPYKSGSLFLGIDPETGAEVGIETERNAITIAGAGGGKGACLIIPNLLRWPYAALVIDPKGENAEETAKQRRAMGQRVGVFDPFGVAKVPKRLRCSINPLNPSGKPDVSPSRDDILAIADGIVRRTDPEAAKWDNGALAIIAGVIAFVCGAAPPNMRTLAEARRVLMQPDVIPAVAAVLDDDGNEIEQAKPVDGLRANAEEMTAMGGLARAAGVSILTALNSGRGADSEFLSAARQHSLWLDSPEIEAALSSTTFKLSDLAKGKATLFIVLPYDKMELYAAFLRLVVRIAQNTIAAAGNKRGDDQKCLFILDEFFTLGKMDEIQKAAGNMRSYGLQLWPFLQDYGQLRDLYGEYGSGTFFANADAHIYFNHTDDVTLARVSNLLDKTLPKEAADAPPDHDAFVEEEFRPWHDSRWLESEAGARERHATRQKNRREAHETKRKSKDDIYQHTMKDAGGARMPPDKVAAFTGKPSAKEPSKAMIVFARSGDVLHVRPAPYYLKTGKDLVPVADQFDPYEDEVANLKQFSDEEKRAHILKHNNWNGWRELGIDGRQYFTRKRYLERLGVIGYSMHKNYFNYYDTETVRYYKRDWKYIWSIPVVALIIALVAQHRITGIIFLITLTGLPVVIFMHWLTNKAYYLIGFLIVRHHLQKYKMIGSRHGQT